MLTLIGLGNPGTAYHRTRHNVGFLVIDELVKRCGVELKLKQSLESEVAEGHIGETRVIFCKPQTFMNASGRAFQKLKKKYGFNDEDVVVIYDDADLPFGDVRVKRGGSSAGHRGMQSVLETVPAGTVLNRIRIGIGRPDHPDIGLEDYVLQRWTQKEEEHMPTILDTAIKLLMKEYA